MSDTTLQSMIDQSREFDSKKVDYPADGAYRSVFYPEGKLFEESDSNSPLAIDGKVAVGPYEMSDHALGQLCLKLGPGTFGKGNGKSLPREAIGLWLKDPQYSRFAAELLNEHITRLTPKLYVRTYDGVVRAVLSDRYATVQNTMILERTQEALNLLSEAAGRTVAPEIFRSSVTPDDLYLRFRVRGGDVLPPGETGPYGFGLFIGNDEGGKSKIKALPAIWRGTCDNTFMIDEGNESALVSRHVGESGVLADRLAEAIGHGIKLGRDYLSRFLSSRRVELPNIFEEITKMSEAEEWSVDFTDAVREGIEGQHSLYGLINGMTFAAHHIYAENQAEMTAWELRAGSLLMKRPEMAFAAPTEQ